MLLANASSASLPPTSHGSGPGWFATPFLYDSCIHYFTQVYYSDLISETWTDIRDRWPKPVIKK
jgi:hypothetical protein